MRKIPWILPILLLAAFLRLLSLSSIPPSPSLDEVSLTYNAYSILTTGADEYGAKFPWLLRAYDDWRPALYVYIIMPFVQVLGLTTLAVRLPSALLSVGSVYLTYTIARLLEAQFLKSKGWGITASFLLAISPWHIYLSRLGHEANLGLFLTVAGVYFLLRTIYEKRQWLAIAAAVSFGLSLHSYQSQKVVVPLLLLVIVFCFGKTIFKIINLRMLLFSVVLFSLLAGLAVRLTLSSEGITRFRGTSAFSADLPIYAEARQQYVKAKTSGNLAEMVLSHRYFVSGRIFMNNYLKHFSSGWLFAGGDRENHKVPGLGLLYWFELPLLLVGLWFFHKSKLSSGVKVLLISWILVSPVPAALTTQSPHAMRAYTMIPALQLIAGLGWLELFKVKSKTIRMAITIGLLFAVIVGINQFRQGYFVRFPQEQSDSFQYALKDAVSYVLAIQRNYDTVIFSNKGNLYQSYMFFLFYSRYDPVLYQRFGGTASGGYAESHAFDKYRFRTIAWEKERTEGKTLYVVDISEIPTAAQVLATFSNKNGQPAVVTLETQNL